MTELGVVKWLCTLVLAVSLCTTGLIGYSIHKQSLALEEALSLSVAREGKLSLDLQQRIERSSGALWRGLYDYQEADLERIRKATELEVARQLHTHPDQLGDGHQQ